ncbi:Dihydroorotate dehydrogenase (fumarate) [Pleurostoma richardsiae]|uniref:Dihydroorotate dehydrogenase (fumarate) n=1 Tax=Pleurostoma richardsiae TaxID=41990 RepID=A0AA38VWE7_9PEZI|nr:Dihydroorotate dehydrogenase (fumarate) [Pleurostoma richardsiae]
MPAPPSLDISPPLINSANPWATSLEDLKALYECPSTGAVTTRTTLLDGFPHDPAKHQYVLFDIATHTAEPGTENASLNNLGYSPHPLDTYLGFIKTISQTSPSTNPKKGFIVSVTGSPDDIVGCYRRIAATQSELPFPLAMEINLSCPNIPGHPPPAYDGPALLQYLAALQDAVASDSAAPRIPFGIKTPPYTHSTEFAVLGTALAACAVRDRDGVCPVSFITATNTLGSCLVLKPAGAEGDAMGAALPGLGTGGLAGAPLHPLALGNVLTIRKMLDVDAKALGHVQVIGIGGVSDAGGYERMKSVGAAVVGVGTGLGTKGLGVFAGIEKGLEGKW